jgi:hypothetical protein
MRLFGAVVLAFCCWNPLEAQAPGKESAAAGEPVVVTTQHPRLFLNATRLRLLKRERERSSERWRQLEALVTGGAVLPEPGFARALYYQISGDAAVGRQAIAWALGPGSDLRQLALVYDWCQDLLSDAQRGDLGARIAKGMADLASAEGVPAASARVLAAVALYDDFPETPQAELDRAVHGWWEGRIAPALKAGKDVVPRDAAYALFELLHAVRDGADLDLRESCPRYFVNLPIERLMSYYPAAYKAPENDFRAGIERAAGAPDPRLAALSRAADLAMVAFDAAAPESQALQGWLMHDPFAMRDAFGAPYDFLWANPYQPGLSYYHLPLAYYDAVSGNLFVRSSWEDSATWFGYRDGAAQKFENGRLTTLNPATAAPVRFDEAVVYFGPSARSFRIKLEEEQRVFVVALEPHRAYRVTIEGQKPFDAPADNGGALELHPPVGREIGVSIQ